MAANRVSVIGGHLMANPTAGKEEPSVLYEVLPGKVALITLNRPSRGNAFTREMQERYQNMLDKADKDKGVNAIVVTGAGKMFCVGADKEDLTEIAPASGGALNTPTYKRDVAQVNALELSKPIVCAINGACAGLGLVAATMADIRFSSAQKDVKFTSAFVKRGLVAEHGITYTLPRIVGMSRALDILLSSRVILADEAYQMGLVNKLFPDAKSCLEGAIEYAREMAKLCSPAAMAEVRRQVYSGWGLTPREDAARSEALMKRSFKHPDFKEGVASLIEKREPKFEGLDAGFIRDIDL